MTKGLLLAVDGGATKTTMTIRTVGGQILFSATSTGSNYQSIGQQQVKYVFDQLLHQAAVAITQRSIQVAVWAISGLDTSENAQIVRSIIKTSLANSPFLVTTVIIENDVEATLLGAANGHPASLLISGTGSICFSFDGQKTVRTGGWGHRAGDEGSGYWIGQQIARAIFRADDERDPPTQLTKLVLQGNHLAHTDALMNWLYDASYTNARLASLSAYLQKAVDQQDTVARQIADAASTELAQLALTALRKMGTAHQFFLNGGILKNNPAIYERFVAIVQQSYPDLTFILCEEQPIEYVVKRALTIAESSTV